MFDALLSILAPHYCYGCDKSGSILCPVCKKHITKTPYRGCVLCGVDTPSGNYCRKHRLPLEEVYCLLPRQGEIAKLIDALKFERKQAAVRPVVDLIDDLLAPLPDEAVLVPIPTTPRHIRVRGYDHMALIGRRLGKLRNIPVTPVLRRRNNITQHFAESAKVRRSQAKSFFRVAGKIDPTKTYVLLDDIFTTGATITEAARCLKKSGATSVMAVVITRHGTPKT